jgi:hypothetical protein
MRRDHLVTRVPYNDLPKIIEHGHIKLKLGDLDKFQNIKEAKALIQSLLNFRVGWSIFRIYTLWPRGAKV